MSEPIQAELIKEVEITITPRKVGKEVKVIIYEVEIINKRTSPGGSWCHTCASEEYLEQYLRGLETGAMMIGGTHIFRPPIPKSDL